MYEGMVEVYSKTTKEKQNVPAHWIDHPVLGRDFAVTPHGQAQQQLATGPTEDWRLEELRDYADHHGVDRTGLRSKAETLAAIEAHAATTAPMNADVPTAPAADPDVDDTATNPTDSPALGDTDSKEE